MNPTPRPVYHERDLHAAMHAIAQRKADNAAPPCANCGAHTKADLLDVTSFGGNYQWLPGITGTCSAQCWKGDPDAYVAAAHRSRETRVH